jgi:4-aminobutyrate aminotransferase/(S)-3-amino-2-methylpropionate transaminase
MNKKQNTLLKKEAKYCSYGDTVHYAKDPIIFESCDGSFLYDVEQKPYLDLQMWYSAANLGYCHEAVNEALRQQLDQLPQLACQYLHREKIELAEAIAKRTQSAYGVKGRVHFNVGGSQAVEDSLKLVRQHTGRSQVFAFWGSYHGRTLGASEITSSYRYRRSFGHFSNRAQFVPYPYCFRCPFNKKKKDCDFYCVKQFEKMFETEYYSVWDSKAKKCEFGAFYAEAVQGTGGYIIPPDGYFPRLKKVLDKHGILLVDDEVQVGMFRTGKFWAMEHFDVKPDIVVFGKGLTNGMNPLSGIWAKESLIGPKQFPPGSTHSTFSSNTMGTTAGLAVMRTFEKEDMAKRVPQLGKKYLSMLQKLQKSHKEIGDVSGIGLTLRLEVCQSDGYTPNRELTDALFQEGLKGDLSYKGKQYGLILDVGGYYKNIFTIAPSFYVTDEEIAMAYDFLDELFRRCKKRR